MSGAGMKPHALLTELPAFSALQTLARELQNTSISQLFAEDPVRVENFTVSAAGLTLDFSKQLLTAPVIKELLALSEQAQISDGISALLSGEEINGTEGRAALHTLLRASTSDMPDFTEVAATRARMRELSTALHTGNQTGFSGKTITDVVNIGIGGSDLGPRLVSEALAPYHGNLRCHYVANVDPADLQGTLANLDPATTLFIVCSKSFRTEETLANSLAARQWILAGGAAETDLSRHFLAVTTNLAAAAEFGITADNCLPIWDWVGGRYSVWSAVGLSVAIAVGWDNFENLLAGAEAMDEHFNSAEAALNMPLLMSLMEIWYCNFHGANSHAVLPYDHSLRQLPDFLQQLTMESNGKRISSDGQAIDYATAPVMWGSAGTLGQHSFHQLLHQGTQHCPVDFVLPLTTQTADVDQHTKLVANCLAQSRTLMVGRSLEEASASLSSRGMEQQQVCELAPHLVMPGNRPNSVITMQALTPATLGALLALYEHRTFCSGWMWGINPFDQWGVELGKEIGVDILGKLEGESDKGAMDPSTEALIARWRSASH